MRNEVVIMLTISTNHFSANADGMTMDILRLSVNRLSILLRYILFNNKFDRNESESQIKCYKRNFWRIYSKLVNSSFYTTIDEILTSFRGHCSFRFICVNQINMGWSFIHSWTQCRQNNPKSLPFNKLPRCHGWFPIYIPRKKKNIIILSSIWMITYIDSATGKPDIIVGSNKTKGGIDIIDQISKAYNSDCAMANGPFLWTFEYSMN